MLDYDTANCAIGAAVGVLGERPTFLVLREAFNGVRRFDDMQRRTGMPRQVLSQRLARLVAEGLLRKVRYQQAGQRSRDEYRLTDKGRDAYSVLAAMAAWGERWKPYRSAAAWYLWRALELKRAGALPVPVERIRLPRVKKRRRNHYGWLTKPRAEMKRQMAKGSTKN